MVGAVQWEDVGEWERSVTRYHLSSNNGIFIYLLDIMIVIFSGYSNYSRYLGFTLVYIEL